jgi:hypothetical protein
MGGTVRLNPPPPQKNNLTIIIIIIIIIITSNIMLNYNRQDKKLHVTSQLYNDNYSYSCHTSLFAQSNVSTREIHKPGHVRLSIRTHDLSRILMKSEQKFMILKVNPTNNFSFSVTVKNGVACTRNCEMGSTAVTKLSCR